MKDGCEENPKIFYYTDAFIILMVIYEEPTNLRKNYLDNGLRETWEIETRIKKRVKYVFGPLTFSEF